MSWPKYDIDELVRLAMARFNELGKPYDSLDIYRMIPVIRKEQLGEYNGKQSNKG